MSMNNTQSKSLLPYLCGFAFLSLILGLSLCFIEQQFSYFSGGLAICGGVLFLILAYVMIRRDSSQVQSPQANTVISPRGWKTIAMVSCIFIGSLGFLGVSHYLASSSTIRWDVTQDKQHTLSDSTIAFVSSLSNEVKLTTFYVGTPPTYLQDLLQEFERNSGGFITAEIIDPLERIAYAAKFGNAINGDERKVIVQSGSSRKDLDFTFNPLSEEGLTNTIASAIRPPRKVYFLAGHGEYSISSEEYAGLSTFKQLLADNSILSDTLMLGISQSIPEDCDVLIIAGPKTELTAEEDTLIGDYLQQGGDALFLIEHTLVSTPEQPLSEAQLKQNPSLNTLLNQWGLDVQSDIVVDLTNHVGDDVGSPATKNYQPHEALTQGLDYTFYVRPRSIHLLENPAPNIKQAVIVSTASSTNSWAETNRNLDIQFDPNIDTPGPVPISYVVLGEHPANSEQDGKPSDTRLIVFTDADFLSNVYINQYSNAKLGLNLVNWLADLDVKTLLAPKNIEVERLDLTSKQKRQVIVILFLIPFFIALAGLGVWFRGERLLT